MRCAGSGREGNEGAEECGVETILVSGGVAGEQSVRATFEERARLRRGFLYFQTGRCLRIMRR